MNPKLAAVVVGIIFTVALGFFLLMSIQDNSFRCCFGCDKGTLKELIDEQNKH